MAEIHNLSVIDASNVGRWPENMPFANVNNAGRADEGMLARWYKDTDASVTASGSSNAFTITSNRSIPALFDNLVMAFTSNHVITGAATLNLNGLGAKLIKRYNGADVAAGDIQTLQPLIVIYKISLDFWVMMTAPAALVTNSFGDFSENAGITNPAADVARLYAQDDGAGNTNLLFRDTGGVASVLRNATQAEMETPNANRIVRADRQHFHPGHPKAAGRAGAAGGITGGVSNAYNVASIVKNSTGNYTVTLTNAMSSTQYWVVATTTSAFGFFATFSIGTASTFNIDISSHAGIATDSGFGFAVYGDM